MPEDWYVKAEAKVALVPLELVTATLTVPAEPAGVTALIWVALSTATEVAAAPPKVTPAPDTKPVPLRVTAVPPAAVPLEGEMPARVGPDTKVKALARLELWPLLLVTVTETVPAEAAGVTAAIWVELCTVTAPEAAPPKLTPAPVRKPVPVRVTAVPPPVGPLLGVTAVMASEPA